MKGSVLAVIAALLCAALPLLAEAADLGKGRNQQDGSSGDQGSSRFLKISSIAEVLWTPSPQDGPFHVEATLALWTSDYFRARYGGVPASLDRLSYRTALSATLELLEGGSASGSLEALSVSFGSLNYFTDSPVPDEDIWYTSDRYVGLAAALEGGLLAGLTYTAYANPFSPPGTPQDVALTLRYAGDNWLGSLQPQIKAVQAVGSANGALIQASVSPVFKPFVSRALTIAAPIAVGVGFDGYHGSGVEEGYYAEFGLLASMPLDFGTPGRWTLTGGTYLTLRDTSIVAATERFDDAGHVVPTGLISLSFTY